MEAKPITCNSDTQVLPNLFIYAYLDLERKTIPYAYRTNTYKADDDIRYPDKR